MDYKKLITEEIIKFVETYGETHEVETKWRTPLVGVADAEDPMYLDVKKYIGSNHAMPQDIVPGAKSVIVIFVPFEESIARSNIPDEESSREWDYASIETNNMLAELSTYLYELITKWGFHASNLPPTYNYDGEKLVSDWSHRSSAVIAGLGKFGIHSMLITDSGCCGRLGSVITDLKLPPDQRSEEEYCLYKLNGSCGKCMKRCPNHAFSVKDGNVYCDRYKCNEQIYDKIVPQWPIGPGDTCGKCMCGVPCSFVNPGKMFMKKKNQ